MNINLRPHQEYVLNKINKELDKHKYFFVNMSTGGGKTLTSLLALRLVKERMFTKCLIATRTKNEFTPYFRDNKKFNLQLKCSGLVGKEDACSEDIIREILKTIEGQNPCRDCYMRYKLLDAETVFTTIYENESLMPILQRKDICPYYSLRETFKHSDCFCVTYPYVFTPRKYILIKQLESFIENGIDVRTLLIIDEAHNIDNITELYERRLNVKSVDVVCNMVLRNEIIANECELLMLKRFLEQVKNPEMKLVKKSEIPRVNLSGLIEWLYTPRSLNEIQQEKNKLRAVSQIVKFYEFLDYPDFEVFTYEHGLLLKLIVPTRLITESLSEFNICILMSGTLPPEDYIERIWGLNGLYVDVTKEFKLYREQKEAYIISNVTTRYKDRDRNYPKYAEIIKNFCKRSNEVKLIVYPSYEVMKRILGMLDTESLEKSIVEDVYTKIEVVKQDVEKGKVNIHCVAGGKLTEGIELIDNDGKSMIKHVVLVGVPYPDVNDYMMVKSKRISQLLGNEQDVFRYCYHIPAVLLSKQAIGRAIRSEQDKCKVFLLDWRFRYMVDELDVTVKSTVNIKLSR